MIWPARYCQIFLHSVLWNCALFFSSSLFSSLLLLLTGSLFLEYVFSRFICFWVYTRTHGLQDSRSQEQNKLYMIAENDDYLCDPSGWTKQISNLARLVLLFPSILFWCVVSWPKKMINSWASSPVLCSNFLCRATLTQNFIYRSTVQQNGVFQRNCHKIFEKKTIFEFTIPKPNQFCVESKPGSTIAEYIALIQFK